ncbi:unnamed protein product [Musa acuminata subsp. malaccensis]|uniref:(wild Malaysian banana) hypothetical protein n=1 Tax=Musa acuminata subsp. malaccensis TaxID=214687 RepID=A0A804KWQ8_MUSAM|nr:unnamed protein product [Musa acuminata subsp. malaccensis]
MRGHVELHCVACRWEHTPLKIQMIPRIMHFSFFFFGSVQHKVLQLFIFSRIASIFSLGSLFPILWVILEIFNLNLILSIVLLP